MKEVKVLYSDILVRSYDEQMVSFDMPPKDQGELVISSVGDFRNRLTSYDWLQVNATGNNIEGNRELFEYIRDAGTKIFVLYRLYNFSEETSKEGKLVATFISKKPL